MQPVSLVDLLIALFLLWSNPQGALPGKEWEYVTGAGATVRLAVVRAERHDGEEAYDTLKIQVGGLDPRPRERGVRFRREVDRLIVQVANSDGKEHVKGLPVPPLTAGNDFTTHDGRSGRVVRASGARDFALAGRAFAAVDVFLLQVEGSWYRLVTAPGEGIVGLERLALPDGVEPAAELLVRPLLPRREWVHAADPARSLGPAAQVHPVLDLVADDGGKPGLPWKGGARGVDPAALGPEGRAASDLEGRALTLLRGDPEDLLLHLETLRRLALYLSTVGGRPLAPDGQALDRMRDFTREFSLATLYGKVERGPRPSFYFDLGMMIEAFRECGARDALDALPFALQAERLEPGNAVVHLGVALCYEAQGLPERADEFRQAALELGAAPTPVHVRLERTLRAGRDDAGWARTRADLAARVAKARPAVPVRLVRRDGREIKGDLLDFGSRVYRIRVGDEILEVEEKDVRKIVFGE